MPDTEIGTVNIKDEEHSHEPYLHLQAKKTEIMRNITIIIGCNKNKCQKVLTKSRDQKCP